MTSKSNLDAAIDKIATDIATLKSEIIVPETITFESPSGIYGPFGSPSTLSERNYSVAGSGWNLGNAGGWSVSMGDVRHGDCSRRGISQMLSAVHNKHAVGDTTGIYVYVYTDGGLVAESDEGATAISGQMSENPGYFHGKVYKTIGVGDQAPALSFTSGNNWTTDGSFLLNISKGSIVGKLAGKSSPTVLTTKQTTLQSFLYSLPVSDVTLPISTAIGIVDDAIPYQNNTADTPMLSTLKVSLCEIGGVLKSFVAGSVVSIAGENYPEQSIIQSVIDNGDGTQMLTLKLRNPNNPKAVIFQGGIQGNYLSFDENLAFSGMRSSYHVFGSLTGSDLIHGFFFAGSTVIQIPMLGNEAATELAPFHLYPGAEIVCNKDLGFAATLEQNGVAWEADDDVENPHNPAVSGGAAFLVKRQSTPSPAGWCAPAFNLLLGGKGVGGSNMQAIQIRNDSPITDYQQGGGPIHAPEGIRLRGCFGTSLYLEQMPDVSQSIIWVQSDATPSESKKNIIVLNYVVGGVLSFDNLTSRWHVDRMDSIIFSASGNDGVDGSFQSADGKTITVQGGLITSIK